MNGPGLADRMAQVGLSQNGTELKESFTPKSSTSGKKPAVEKSKKSIEKPKNMSSQAAPASAPLNQLPDYMLARNELFDHLKKQRDAEVAAKDKPEIQITLIIGSGEESMVIGKAWETTPGQMLRHVPKDIASSIVVARVDGTLWDLDRPLVKNSKVAFVSSKEKDGRDVFWHSSAHVLGECCEHEYGCKLSHGPPTNTGFFYDMALEPGRAVNQSEWPAIEARAKKYFKEKQPFERLEVSKENLKKMFGYSKYKMHYIDKFVEEGGSSTVYRNGSLVDLCTGPHIQSTKKIETFKIMKNSSAYFLGDQNNDSLQRIHGVAFGSKQEMKDWETFLEEAKKRDHQKIGKDQELWMFSQMSPGSAFFLPHGTRIFNALQDMLRKQYRKRRYQEVQSPNMYDVDLWKTSGHWAHYRDDMFQVRVKDDAATDTKAADVGGATQAVPEDKDKGLFALKPMNCPGHCMMYRDRERSYRELPWRVADFGVLHRNEASGALSGLTRVRKFQQDDTHIFCTNDQVTQEIKGLFDFMSYVYGLFGFPFKLKFSTRPEGFLGTIETWDKAEAQLKQALTDFRGNDWELNEGDGAFYGPKIDVVISDALGREFQCATIQLDFQLPQNFKLEYMTGEQQLAPGEKKEKDAKENSSDAVNSEIVDPNKDNASKDPFALSAGRARPVMIHRAIIGSFERFIAVLCEHFAGKWPFWLSPRQIMVIPVMKGAEDYVREIQNIFDDAEFWIDADLSGNTLQKKIRSAQIAQYNFIFGNCSNFYIRC